MVRPRGGNVVQGMTRLPIQDARRHDGSALAELVGANGTAVHPHAAALAATGRRDDPRQLADAVHYLCMLHGRHPGVIDNSAGHVVHTAARGWIVAACDAFANERAVLARLVGVVGPLPSTPGQAQAEAAIGTQRHALDMLSQSDRAGCAAGAALALALDWTGVRAVLAAAAHRCQVDVAASLLPPAFETIVVAEAIADAPPLERAMMFGASQLLAQQRALWDILQARAEARG